MNTQLDAPAQSPGGASGFVSLADWRKKRGRSRSTIYRWRREGIIREDDVRQLYGKLYISAEGIAHVDSLIASQELAKPLRGCVGVSQSAREQRRKDRVRDKGATTAQHQAVRKPRRLSNRQLEAAYALGGLWAMFAASKASFRAKPCAYPQTEKDTQRVVRWRLLTKYFGGYVAVRIAAANGLLKGGVKANLNDGITAAAEFKFDHNVLLKDAVRLVKRRWDLVRYIVEEAKASPSLWLLGGPRVEVV